MSLQISSQIHVKENFPKLSAEERAKAIISWEKKQEKEEDIKDFFKAIFPKQEEEKRWETNTENYIKCEKFLEKNNYSPQWEVYGPLNYRMSPPEMKKKVQEIFKKMVQDGTLAREKVFFQARNRDYFFPTKESYRRNDLTRMWGAKYLNDKLPVDSNVKAAKHYLVVDDNATELEVVIWHGNPGFPILNSVENENAQILSEKITGTKKAWEYLESEKSEPLKKLGFTDFSDPGNIIACNEKNKDGKEQEIGYVVDTEAKSFTLPQYTYEEGIFRKYIARRFNFLYGDEISIFSQHIKISLDEIGLKYTHSDSRVGSLIRRSSRFFL